MVFLHNHPISVIKVNQIFKKGNIEYKLYISQLIVKDTGIISIANSFS